MNVRALDLGVLFSLLRGLPDKGSHAENLEAFYRPQAAHYDSFRERLLAGRRDLIGHLDLPDGATVVELGGGTGQNLAFFGERLARLGSVEIVDLCPALLAQAHRRAAGHANVRVIEADATTYRPAAPVDCVFFSYALTMMPDWRVAIDNALAMLKPGGQLGVVDFYVSAADSGRGRGATPGSVRHGAFTRHFWPLWFAHDGVRPTPEHLACLRMRMPGHIRQEALAPVPYLPGLRVPYYSFIGRKSGATARDAVAPALRAPDFAAAPLPA
jgi:S-adenosylmethionine-diacylgycerolhomoserine-N-methlytransferase